TVLGDGAVVLILDIPGLADHGGVAATELAAPAFGDAQSAPKPAGEPHLLLAGPDDGRLALPLSRVLRLERISLAALERVGSEEILPYREGPLRIVRLTRLLPERRKSARRLSPENPDQAHVVVCVSGGQPVGVAVHRILDIVDEIPADTRPGGRPGVRSTVIVRGRVTELLDLDALLAGPAGSP
ncbi:MAG TPA: chemotaxis protein CheW, partial [Elusimicrobiota bacterium]|nr:chemotaxis protein CheW [Elusimicrobiota bacterium]